MTGQGLFEKKTELNPPYIIVEDATKAQKIVQHKNWIFYDEPIQVYQYVWYTFGSYQ